MPAAAFAGPSRSPARRRHRSAYAAAAWSLGYALLGLYWWSGGGGFPYGAGNDSAARISLLGGVTQATAAPVIAGLGLLGALIAVSMTTYGRGGLTRAVLAAFGIGAAVTLALLIPDYRLFVLVAYAPIAVLGAPFGLDPAALLEVIDVPMINQLACVGGGLLWASASVGYLRATRESGHERGEADSWWPGATRAAEWGRWATYVAIAVPVVYAVTRYTWALGIPLGISEELFLEGQKVGLWSIGAALASLALVGAFLTLGLIRPWGEVFPHWMPIIGGRRVPRALVIIPASLMAVLVTNAGLMYWRLTFSGGFELGGIRLTLDDSWAALAPELLWPVWGVALGAATAAYSIRHRFHGETGEVARPEGFEPPTC